MRMLKKAFIKRSRVTRSPADTKAFPTVQAEYNGKVRMVAVVNQYGHYARVPVDAIGYMFNINGNEDDQAAIFDTPMERFKLAAEGEVAFGNPKSGSVIYFRESGDIIQISKNDFGMLVDGNLDISAINTAINSDVAITGGLSVSNGITAGGKTGVDGTFTTTDGKTVQVKDGIIWSIV